MGASQSRGAWLGFVVAAGTVLAVHGKRMFSFLVIVALVITLVVLAGTFESAIPQMSNGPSGQVVALISQRLESALAIMTIDDIGAVEVNDANFALIERLAHWQAAREMWRDHPWLGVGFGNYEIIYPVYAVGRWFNPLGHAHNYLLNIGAETGLIGISGYAIFWILAFGVTYMAIYQSTGFDQAVAAGVLGILAHLHVHNLFDNLYVQGMYLHLAIILALVSIIYYRHSQRRQEIAGEVGEANMARFAQRPGRYHSSI
jgi:O-antigen ligase